MFMRSKHFGRGDINLRVGMAQHIMFNSLRKMWRQFQADHVVFCLEGRSWRKDFYKPYKANRRAKAAERSIREQEDDEIFMESFDALVTFLVEKTNVTVLRHPECEADDLIAVWCQSHPDDQHVIISTDSDFHQLLAHNVRQYNGVQDALYTVEGVFNPDTLEPITDKKTGKPLPAPDPEWLLFEKCVRGDTSDNIFSAYPGARKQGTRNKTGMLEAFADRDSGGFAYNNFMLQRWTDHNDCEHRVRDDYERNRTLIDLTQQPAEIRAGAQAVITEAKQAKHVSNVGINFMRYCGQWELTRLAQHPDDFARMLSAPAV